MLYPPARLSGATRRGQTMVPGGRGLRSALTEDNPTAIGAYNLLRHNLEGYEPDFGCPKKFML